MVPATLPNVRKPPWRQDHSLRNMGMRAAAQRPAGEGGAMTTPVRASDRDLRALAAIVSENRTDLPDGEGLPLSLLADLMSHIRWDRLAFIGNDSARHAN
jgi:hypothetical protein